MQNMNYQRMSSSSENSDEDDCTRPSSFMKYWEEIRPSSTDEEEEDSEPVALRRRNWHPKTVLKIRALISINRMETMRRVMKTLKLQML